MKGRDVLLVMRGKEPGYGEWSIPGGAIHVGETMEQAVVREISEEVGILTDPVQLVGILDRIIHDERGMVRYHYVLLDFLCLYRSGKAKPGSDVLEARWVRDAELGGYALPEETEEVIRKGLEVAGSILLGRKKKPVKTTGS
ncbi:MAG: NUDIX hydrolase [Deltaproteobacteria bacterium]|nr:NUDIX hydrolase [Deltaproteobacteria bacterium]MBW2120697.1 NUDIX hydrolase [Deltaproteobacteria bacterium]